MTKRTPGSFENYTLNGIRQTFPPDELKLLDEADLGSEKHLDRIVRGRFIILGQILHRMHGKEMLEMSQKMARSKEKTWYMITINLCDWKARWAGGPLPMRCILSANSWETEHIPVMLEMLHSMNADTEYMLSMELFDTDSSAGTVFSSAMIPCRLEQSKYRVQLDFDPVCQFIVDPEGVLIHRHCHTCVKSQCKLYRCRGCKVQSYCSSECQQKDWKTHKKVCTILNNLRSQRNLEALD